MSSKRPKSIEVGAITARPVRRYRKGGDAYFIRADGRAYWQARAKGTRQTVWSGWATRDEAMAVITRVASRTEGQTPQTRVVVRTVRELMEAWMAHQRDRMGKPRAAGGITPRTVAFYEKAARHAVAWLGDVQVASLSAAALQDYVQARLGEGASERLVKSEVARIRQAWVWGADRGFAPDRRPPAAHVRVDENRFVINHRTPTLAEISAVLSELSGDARLAVRLLATTGARVGEVCRLTGGDIDGSAGTLLLVGKTGPRTFPLRGTAQELFAELAQRAQRDVNAPLLPGLRASGREQHVRDALRRACDCAGVSRFTPHGLRRYVVNRLLDAKVDLKVAASITGHSVEVMLRFYRSATAGARAEAIAQAGLGDLGAAC